MGAPRAAGGVCATLRDLARVGVFMIEHPSPWIGDLERGGDAAAWAAGDLAPYFGGVPLRYRSHWCALEGSAPLVVVMDAARIGLMLRAVAELRKRLA